MQESHDSTWQAHGECVYGSMDVTLCFACVYQFLATCHEGFARVLQGLVGLTKLLLKTYEE